MSIATAQFSKIALACVIPRMQVVSETRRQRLSMLVKKFGGSLAALNEALDLDRTDATLSQIRTSAPHSVSGKPRSMGETLARKIEQKLGLEHGWMDTPEGADWPFAGVSQADYLALAAEQRGIVQGRLAGMIEDFLCKAIVAKSKQIPQNVFPGVDMDVGDDQLFVVGTLHHATKTRQAKKQS